VRLAIPAGEERPQQLHGVVVAICESAGENAPDLVGIPARRVRKQGRQLWLVAQKALKLKTHGKVDVGFDPVGQRLAMRRRRKVSRAAVAGGTPKHRGQELCEIPSLIIPGHTAPLRFDLSSY
jgi:hypothetical protein